MGYPVDTENNLPRHKFNKLPYHVGLFLMTIGCLMVISALLLISINISHILSTGEGIDGGIDPVMDMIFKGMICILVGYSNRSFIRGISYKAQRNFVLMGILMTIYVISHFMLILLNRTS